MPKLIGTYEQELHPVVERLRNKTYTSFIDIGAAEGYYAIGLAKFILPQTCNKVVFEQEKRGRRLIKALAHMNNIADVTIKGFCSPDALQQVLQPDFTFILMDIEGGEEELLQPMLADFTNADILVELHPGTIPGIQDTIIERFKLTHHIQVIPISLRQFPVTISLPTKLMRRKEFLMNEYRGKQCWLWMQAKKER